MPGQPAAQASAMIIGPDGAIRGQVRAAGYDRKAHGLYRTETPHLCPWENFLKDLSALRLILEDNAVFTHVTGARLLGWQLPALPSEVPVFVAVRGEKRPRRPGILCSRLTHESTPMLVHGMPVDEPAEILLRAARDLGELDLAIMLDSAASLGHLEEEAMQKVLQSKRPGVTLLRKVWLGRNERSESAGETLLHRFHQVMDVATTPQVDIFDDNGEFICRADLVVDGTTSLHEYDGAGHRDKNEHKRDLRRERRIASSPYVRRGYTLDDLLNHAGALMHELDRLLGRPHNPSRLRAWRALVDDSLYGDKGRKRVMNRWARSTTPVNWARTA